jgi:hypothetical protein
MFSIFTPLRRFTLAALVSPAAASIVVFVGTSMASGRTWTILGLASVAGVLIAVALYQVSRAREFKSGPLLRPLKHPATLLGSNPFETVQTRSDFVGKKARFREPIPPLETIL